MRAGDETVTAVVEKDWFQWMIAFVIILNIITIGIETDALGQNGSSDDPVLWLLINSFFAGVFVIEFGLKFAHYRLRCLKSWSQIFDFFLVILAIIDTWILYFVIKNVSVRTLSMLRVLRVVRLSRVLKFMTRQTELRLLMHSLMDIHKILIPMVLVMVVVLYFTALVMSVFYRSGSDDWVYPPYSRWSGNEYWGSVPRSMFTLFQLTTGDSWAGGVVRPLLRVYPLYSLIFIPFMAVMFIAFKATLVAKLCDHIIQSGSVAEGRLEFEESRTKGIVKTLEDNFIASKEGGRNGGMTFENVEQLIKVEKNRRLLTSLNVPVSDLAELFYILDWSRREVVEISLFFNSILRLTGLALGRDVTSIQMKSQKIVHRMSVLSSNLGRLDDLINEVFLTLSLVAQKHGLTHSSLLQEDLNVIKNSL